LAKYVNQRDAAERLNLTTRQVNNLVSQGLPTRSTGGKVTYPFPDCIRWYVEHKVRTALAALEPEDGEEAKRRLTTAQARKAEIEVEALEGRMVLVDDTIREVGAMLDALRSNLLAFPTKHANRLVGCKTIAEVTRKLEPAVAELMTVLADGEGDE